MKFHAKCKAESHETEHHNCNVISVLHHRQIPLQVLTSSIMRMLACAQIFSGFAKGPRIEFDMEALLDQTVLVLNRLWQAVNTCSVRRAFTLVYQGTRAGGFNGRREQLPDARFPELAGFFKGESGTGNGSHDFGQYSHSADYRACCFSSGCRRKRLSLQGTMSSNGTRIPVNTVASYLSETI